MALIKPSIAARMRKQDNVSFTLIVYYLQYVKKNMKHFFTLEIPSSKQNINNLFFKDCELCDIIIIFI